MNKASRIYLGYWNDVLVSFCAVLPLIGSSSKFAFRTHRLVVLPDYQGLGIGTRMQDAIAQMYLDQGNKYYIKSTHLKLDTYFQSHPTWVATCKNKKTRFDSNECAHPERVCVSYEYKGQDYIDKPHLDIHIDYTDKINMDLFKADIAWLKKKYYLTVIVGKQKEITPIETVCQELGIRTQLLYYLGKISGKYSNKKIITEWTQEFSNEVRDYYG